MLFRRTMPTLLAVLFTASCQVDRLEVPADELYTREFIKEFGVCDPNQDWNAATSVTAQVDASSIPSTATVYIYDRMPGADGCQLAAQFSAKTGNFSFDFAKHNTRAYVQVTDQNGTTLLSSYLPITSSTLTISPRPASRATETKPNVQLVDFKEWDGGNTFANAIGSFDINSDFSNGYWNDKRNLIEDYNTNDNWQKYLSLFKIYGLASNNIDYLRTFYRGEFSSQDDARTLSDLASIVGSKGVFHEKVGTNENGQNECNLHKYRNELKPEDGVVYDAPNGEVTLEYIYGAAAFYNSFGYFYYKEGATQEEILKAPKFILMLDASPWTNTKRYENGNEDQNWRYRTAWTEEMVNDEGEGRGTKPSDDIEAFEASKNDNVKYKPSFYKLIYYPIKANGEYDLDHPTYKFEKGIKIAFFSLTHGFQKISRNKQYAGQSDGGVNHDYPRYIPDKEFRFSLPWMNQVFGQRHDVQNAHGDCAFDNNTPMMSFVNYRWNGVSVMGVEDGTYGESDHDMNDILFFVHGVEDDSPNFETYPYAQSWVVACEDLGSTYDFDFNDMVFGVSYVATDETNRKVYIKALAAGGTMPIELYRNGVKLGEKGHWNHWFGESDHSVVINAYGGGVKEGDEFEITLGENEEFSLTSALFRPEVDENKAMGGFSVRVNGKTWVKPVGTVGAEGYAPQMMLLPVGWSWPTEHTPIYEAYPGNGADIPGFREWYHSGDYTIWNKLTPADGKVFKHDWKGHTIENK